MSPASSASPGSSATSPTTRALRALEMLRDHRAQRFEPPAGLDSVAAREKALATGWKHGARVAFDAPAARVAPWVHAVMGRLEPQGEGCVLVGTTSNPEM